MTQRPESGKMRRTKASRQGLWLALAIGFLQASASAGYADDCSAAISQTDMDVCAAKQYDAADQALNKTYAELMAKITPAGQASLREAQRAWLAYRDKQCAFNLLARSDASVYPMVMAYCKAGLTEQQTAQLKAQLNCEEGDLSCGGQ